MFGDLLNVDEMKESLVKSWESEQVVERTVRNLCSRTNYLMCPVCYNLTKIKMPAYVTVLTDEINLKDMRVLPTISGTCNECGIESVQIQLDADIAAAVAMLNKKGYLTKYCCEGHHDVDRAYIMFKDAVPDTQPIGWRYDCGDKSTIDALYSNGDMKADLLINLQRWVESLPTREVHNNECLNEDVNRRRFLKQISEDVWNSFKLGDYITAESEQEVKDLTHCLRKAGVRFENKEFVRQSKEDMANGYINLRKIRDDVSERIVTRVDEIPDNASCTIYTTEYYK